MGTGPNRDADSVLGKAGALLAALAADEASMPLGLSELARKSNVSKATAYRLANELAEMRLLEQTDSGYRLGPWLFELGQRVPRFHDIAHVAEPFAEDLHKATGQTVHFGIRDGHEVMYLIKVRGHGGIDKPSRVAGRMPVHCTASGRALLAVDDPDVLEDVIAAGLERRTRHTIVHPPALRDIIDSVNDIGVATETEEVQLGLGAIASPVFGPSGPVAAIGIVLPLSDGRPEQYRTAVRTSALYLSRVLAQQPGLRAPT